MNVLQCSCGERRPRLSTQQWRPEYVSPYEIAVNYARMGDRDQTFEWLEKAYAEPAGAWNT
jgi:hypothetical protein